MGTTHTHTHAGLQGQERREKNKTRMVLDIALFRDEQTREEVRASQNRRAKHLDAVDNVVKYDAEWVKSRKHNDNLNYASKLTAKCVGEKMKKKEPIGDSTDIPESLLSML